MADGQQAKQQHLDDHYGDLGLQLIDLDDDKPGKGMSSPEASAFLKGLRPRLRQGMKLKDLAKKG